MLYISGFSPFYVVICQFTLQEIIVKVFNSRMTITNADTISCENKLFPSENATPDLQIFLVDWQLETADLECQIMKAANVFVLL